MGDVALGPRALEVPAGAFESATTVTIRRADTTVGGEVTPVRQVYDVSFESTEGPQL